MNLQIGDRVLVGLGGTGLMEAQDSGVKGRVLSAERDGVHEVCMVQLDSGGQVLTGGVAPGPDGQGRFRNLAWLISDDPKPGMACTVQVGSDSYAGKVRRVSESGKTAWIDLDNGGERVARLRKGGWRTQGATSAGTCSSGAPASTATPASDELKAPDRAPKSSAGRAARRDKMANAVSNSMAADMRKARKARSERLNLGYELSEALDAIESNMNALGALSAVRSTSTAGAEQALRLAQVELRMLAQTLVHRGAEKTPRYMSVVVEPS